MSQFHCLSPWFQLTDRNNPFLFISIFIFNNCISFKRAHLCFVRKLHFYLPNFYNVVRQIMLYIAFPSLPPKNISQNMYLRFCKVSKTHWFAWSHHYKESSWVNWLSYNSKCNLRTNGIDVLYTSAATN